MASHWKSTPSYWCKFCETYVRDTPIERKNHETTGKHQGNIQRQLRDLHRRKEREQRDHQRAKDEVARLNGLVGGDKGKASSTPLPPAAKPAPPPPQAPVLSAAAQRKAHAEQLAALGVALPEELKKEVTGVGGWSTVSETVIEAPKSMAEIKQEEELKAQQGVLNKGVHKRKAEDDGEEGGEEVVQKRKLWGSSLKSYPGAGGDDEGGEEDLDALLSGVGTKKEGAQEQDSAAQGEQDDGEAAGDVKAASAATGSPAVADDGVKQEDEGSVVTAPPTVVFKKRKAKR